MFVIPDKLLQLNKMSKWNMRKAIVGGVNWIALQHYIESMFGFVISKFY